MNRKISHQIKADLNTPPSIPKNSTAKSVNFIDKIKTLNHQKLQASTVKSSQEENLALTGSSIGRVAQPQKIPFNVNQAKVVSTALKSSKGVKSPNFGKEKEMEQETQQEEELMLIDENPTINPKFLEQKEDEKLPELEPEPEREPEPEPELEQAQVQEEINPSPPSEISPSPDNPAQEEIEDTYLNPSTQNQKPKLSKQGTIQDSTNKGESIRESQYQFNIGGSVGSHRHVLQSDRKTKQQKEVGVETEPGEVEGNGEELERNVF